MDKEIVEESSPGLGSKTPIKMASYEEEQFSPMRYRHQLKSHYSQQKSNPSFRQSSNPSLFISSATLGGSISQRSLRSQRDPQKYYLHQFREPKRVFKPLYEIFICYGQEEFFDTREVKEVDGKAEVQDFNFPNMVEKKIRKTIA